tara:strand:- start:516 stop:842 length:327 start_codon:yes stop_codon:yes gene_type:complete
LSDSKIKQVSSNSEEFLISLIDLYEALVSIDEKNKINELANWKNNLDFLGNKISSELYSKLEVMSSEVINMPSSWSGDLEEAMRIDILTSKIEPLWENFDAEWKKHFK